MIKSLLIIALGSATGGALRYYLSKIAQGMISSNFPLGTLAVNLLGCLCIGILYALFEKENLMNNYWRLFLIVGFCGGFTTFSSFIGDNFNLIRNGQMLMPLLYLGLSVVGGYALLAFGYTIIKNL